MIIEPPKVQFDRNYPSGLSMKVGSTQTISATISGIPIPKINWYKDGKPLSAVQAKIETDEFSTQITLKEAEVSASGSYRVAVENDVGSSSVDVYVNVRGMYM